jgi:NitT/TauT family transport system permease protein
LNVFGKKLSDRWLGVLAIIAALLFWQAMATLVVKNPFILPSPVDVINAFIDLLRSNTLLKDIGVSLLHFGIGLGSALIIGIPIGMVMGYYRGVDAFLDPLIEIIRPIPPLAWIPFAIVWFGLTNASAGFLIFIGAVFPILINTYTGFRSIPRIFVEAGKMLGCSRDRDLIRYIAFPSSLPQIAAGIRIASGVGWMCLVAAELFGVSKYGLGQKLWHFYNLHQMDKVVVYMLLLGIIGLLLDWLFRYYIDHHFLRWRMGEVA